MCLVYQLKMICRPYGTYPSLFLPMIPTYGTYPRLFLLMISTYGTYPRLFLPMIRNTNEGQTMQFGKQLVLCFRP